MSLLLLLDLSLRGSLVVMVVLSGDSTLGRKMRARWRRVWWFLVPLAFLLPFFVTTYRPIGNEGRDEIYASSLFSSETPRQVDLVPHPVVQIPAGPFADRVFFWIGLVWLTGVVIIALRILISTWKVEQKWSGKRLSTDAALLDLLEDAKITAGVTAPIGLVISDQIAAPALLGWLRPRILLPVHLTTDSSDELRTVLLHELAHFKALDIPLNWLFAATRVIHWFNPLAWLATSAWSRFREEASDENAIRWLKEPTGTAYGEILLKTLGKCPAGPAPYGALAIGESIENLKRRILMIRNYQAKSSRGGMAFAVVVGLGLLMAVSPMLAVDAPQENAKKDAVTAMQTWLGEIDAGSYAKSWSDSAQSFQKALTSDKWVGALDAVRTPLGKMLSRNLDSAVEQTAVPKPNGDLIKGDWVIAQFNSSFENFKSARETVTFEKEADGSWRAAGYFIKPQ
jgi:beta-lactamase regulating signal transducer with metallopeptidase domain